MGTLVVGLRALLSPMGASPFRLATLIVAGVLAYGGLVAVFQRRAVRDLLAVVRA
jgi:hypothetical protein